MWLLFTKWIQDSTQHLSWNEVKQDYLATTKVLERMLANDFWGNDRGISHASIVMQPNNCHGTNVIDDMSLSWQDNKWAHTCFCNLKLPTQPNTPSIFSSFGLGAFGLANPGCPLFFWLPSYLSLPLSLPRAQIKQLGSLISLHIYSSAKLELFGQIFILYFTTANSNMEWSRLNCWAIHQVW